MSLVLAGMGIWLFAHDRPELKHESRLRQERAELEAKITQAAHEIGRLEPLIPPEQEKVVGAEKVIRQLEQLQSTWDLVVGNRAQQKANAERLERMRSLHSTSVVRVAEFQQQLADARRTLEGISIERTRVDAQLRVEDTKKAGAVSQLNRLWLQGRPWFFVSAGIAMGAFALFPLFQPAREQKKGSEPRPE